MKTRFLPAVLLCFLAVSPVFADDVKTVRILTIGNSFANNALVYLPEITESVPGHEIIIRRANLPGASLQDHAEHIEAYEDDPTLAPYGNNNFSLKELLLAQKWDVVTIQQASPQSFRQESCHPYADEVVAYIRQHAPGADIVIHQTWAYAPDSPRLQNWDTTRDEMHGGLTEAYDALSRHFGGLRQLRSGEAFYRSFEAHPDVDLWNESDRFHANPNGQYLAGLVWFSELFDTSPTEVTFVPDGMEPETAAKLREAAASVGQAEVKNILFIGNSFTFRNELPALVKEVFEEGRPGTTFKVKRITYGGQSLFQHYTYYFTQTFIEEATISDAAIRERIEAMRGLLTLEEPPQEYVDFWTDIRQNRMQDFPKNHISQAISRHEDLLKSSSRTHWDYIVLQSWRDDVADVDAGYAKYARLLAGIAAEQGSEVILYFTAPFIQNHPAISPLSGPHNQADVDRTLKLAINLARDLEPRAVVHVPLAINRIQQGGTDLTFRYDNDFHPNQRTAFLTANLFYAAFFGESTEGFSFDTVTETRTTGEPPHLLDPDGGPATMVFHGEEKSYLQQMAYKAAIEFDQLVAPKR